MSQTYGVVPYLLGDHFRIMEGGTIQVEDGSIVAWSIDVVSTRGYMRRFQSDDTGGLVSHGVMIDANGIRVSLQETPTRLVFTDDNASLAYRHAGVLNDAGMVEVEEEGATFGFREMGREPILVAHIVPEPKFCLATIVLTLALFAAHRRIDE